MLTQVATALSGKPDIALPLRGKATDESSRLRALGIAMSFGRNMKSTPRASRPVTSIRSSPAVRISRLLPDGRRQISAFHSPGDMFGFEVGDLHYASAEAVTAVKIIAIWESHLRPAPARRASFVI
jgi:CRP/FNR family nitrogen fixation transcriptional regulator